MARYQHVDLRFVLRKLNDMETSAERILFLSQQYPCLYIHVLKKRGRIEEMVNYMQECKKLENDYKKFSLYLHGYLLPWFHLLRKSGKLSKGT